MPNNREDNYRERTHITLGGFKEAQDMLSLKQAFISMISRNHEGKDKIKRMVIGQEPHADGEWHYHCGLEMAIGISKRPATARNQIKRFIPTCNEINVKYYPKHQLNRMFRYCLKPEEFPETQLASDWESWDWAAQAEDGTYTNIKAEDDMLFYGCTLAEIMAICAATAEPEDLVQDTISLIQSKRSWAEVLTDRDTCVVAQKKGTWAMDIFNARPQKKPKLCQELCDAEGKPDGSKLCQWQQALYGYLYGADGNLNEPTAQVIIWIWGQQGESGKSELKKFLENTDRTIYAGKFTEQNMYDYNNEDIIWYDDFNMKADGSDGYKEDFLKRVCDLGTMGCAKYKGRKFTCSSHVLVTCNFPPMGSDPFMRRIIEIQLNGLKVMKTLDHNTQVGAKDKPEREVFKTYFKGTHDETNGEFTFDWEATRRPHWTETN